MNTFSHGYALVIGINENAIGSMALPGVAADIAAIQHVLLDPERCAYPSENVRVLQGSEATRKGIRQGLAWLCGKLMADAQSTAIIYYSGHGWKDRYSGEYFFIPYDIEAGSLRYSALRAADFAAEVSKMQPPRLLVLLDCCHAQGMGVKDVTDIEDFTPASLPAAIFMGAEKGVNPALKKNTQSSKGLDALAQGHGRAVLSSSQGDQKSYLRAGGEMSLFTYHLIEALTGHAAPQSEASEVLVSDLAGYVQRHVPESARQMGVIQEPEALINGVFPVALLLGGKGLAKGANPPDPLGNGVIGNNNTVVGAGGVVVQGNSSGDIVTGVKTLINRGIHVDGSVTGSTFVTGDHNKVQVGRAKPDSG